jgi:hypothetical protein
VCLCFCAHACLRRAIYKLHTSAKYMLEAEGTRRARAASAVAVQDCTANVQFSLNPNVCVCLSVCMCVCVSVCVCVYMITHRYIRVFPTGLCRAGAGRGLGKVGPSQTGVRAGRL